MVINTKETVAAQIKVSEIKVSVKVKKTSEQLERMISLLCIKSELFVIPGGEKYTAAIRVADLFSIDFVNRTLL